MYLKQITKYNTKTMKKLILTVVTGLTILFAQAQQCQADFSYIQNGSTTVFTDLSTINTGWSTNYSLTWEWDFGDGTISTQQSPVHTYANNGIYTPCLTVLYFDSVIINSCVSFYCDTLLIGNVLPCPGSATISQNGNNFTVNMTGGVPPFLYLWSTGESTQSIVASVSTSGYCDVTDANGCIFTDSFSYITNPPQIYWCDSMSLFSTGGSTQTILMSQVLNINNIIASWITTAPDGTVLGVDSMSNSHQIFNNMNNGQPYDTINICITYALATGYSTSCCVTWIWDANTGNWSRMGAITSKGEIGTSDKKILKVVDVLGRETSINSNKILFFIYDDGTIEKRYIIDRK